MSRILYVANHSKLRRTIWTRLLRPHTVLVREYTTPAAMLSEPEFVAGITVDMFEPTIRDSGLIPTLSKALSPEAIPIIAHSLIWDEELAIQSLEDGAHYFMCAHPQDAEFIDRLVSALTYCGMPTADSQS